MLAFAHINNEGRKGLCRLAPATALRPVNKLCSKLVEAIRSPVKPVLREAICVGTDAAGVSGTTVDVAAGIWSIPGCCRMSGAIDGPELCPIPPVSEESVVMSDGSIGPSPLRSTAMAAARSNCDDV